MQSKSSFFDLPRNILENELCHKISSKELYHTWRLTSSYLKGVAEKTLFSRNDQESINYQDRLLSQWCRLPAHVKHFDENLMRFMREKLQEHLTNPSFTSTQRIKRWQLIVALQNRSNQPLTGIFIDPDYLLNLNKELAKPNKNIRIIRAIERQIISLAPFITTPQAEILVETILEQLDQPLFAKSFFPCLIALMPLLDRDKISAHLDSLANSYIKQFQSQENTQYLDVLTKWISYLNKKTINNYAKHILDYCTFDKEFENSDRCVALSSLEPCVPYLDEDNKSQIIILWNYCLKNFKAKKSAVHFFKFLIELITTLDKNILASSGNTIIELLLDIEQWSVSLFQCLNVVTPYLDEPSLKKYAGAVLQKFTSAAITFTNQSHIAEYLHLWMPFFKDAPNEIYYLLWNSPYSFLNQLNKTAIQNSLVGIALNSVSSIPAKNFIEEYFVSLIKLIKNKDKNISEIALACFTAWQPFLETKIREHVICQLNHLLGEDCDLRNEALYQLIQCKTYVSETHFRNQIISLVDKFDINTDIQCWPTLKVSVEFLIIAASYISQSHNKIFALYADALLQILNSEYDQAEISETTILDYLTAFIPFLKDTSKHEKLVITLAAKLEHVTHEVGQAALNALISQLAAYPDSLPPSLKLGSSSLQLCLGNIMIQLTRDYTKLVNIDESLSVLLN